MNWHDLLTHRVHERVTDTSPDLPVCMGADVGVDARAEVVVAVVVGVCMWVWMWVWVWMRMCACARVCVRLVF